MKSLIIFVLLFVNVCSLTEIVIILGCSNNLIQKERVNSGLNYIKQSQIPKILYLSGGIKNNLLNDIPESKKMLKQIKKQNLDIKIIFDDESKNTAENFVNLKNWLKNNKINDEILLVVVTSDFHKKRALKLFKGIFKNIKSKFVTSKSDCIDCWNDEKIHMQNIKSDIMNAIIFLD